MPLTGARRPVMFMRVAAVRGVQEAASGLLDADNSSRRQLHAPATGAGYYGAVGTSASRGDNNARDCHYPDRRARAAAVAAAAAAVVDVVVQKRLPRVIIV